MSLFITSSTIKVLIGAPSSRIELSIHRELAVSRSGFFAEALSGNWSKSDTQTVDLHSLLPNMDSNRLAQYLQELYSTTNTLNDNRDITDICNIYVIAEALLDVETRNRAVRSLYNAMRSETTGPHQEYLFPNLGLIAMVYAHTASADNPMRRLLVDVYYDKGCQEWFEDYAVAPKELLWPCR